MIIGHTRHPRIRFSTKEKLQEFLDLVSEHARFVFGVDFLPRPDSVMINFKPEFGTPPAVRKWLDDHGSIGFDYRSGQIRIIAACHLKSRQYLRMIKTELERHLRSGMRVRGPLLDRLWEITGLDVPAGMYNPACVGV